MCARTHKNVCVFAHTHKHTPSPRTNKDIEGLTRIMLGMHLERSYTCRLFYILNSKEFQSFTWILASRLEWACHRIRISSVACVWLKLIDDGDLEIQDEPDATSWTTNVILICLGLFSFFLCFGVENPIGHLGPPKKLALMLHMFSTWKRYIPHLEMHDPDATSVEILICLGQILHMFSIWERNIWDVTNPIRPSVD